MSSGDGKIIGRPVLTFNGRRLGVIEDVYFGENMDKPLLGYELSDGFMTDLTEGRKWLPVNDSFTFGEEAVLVPAETERDLKEITQSMKE